MSLTAREATVDDFTAYVGAPPPTDWSRGEVRGYVVERDATLVAIGIATEDRDGQLWMWANVREPVPAIILHRCGVRLLDALRGKGHAAVHAFCDSRLPTSERWLRKLGFVPGQQGLHPTGEMRTVWRCNLAT